jgi:DNA-binding transcriptional ArsR family regulator
MMLRMARACTTLDAFNAVAEPKRRRVLDVLAGRERPVNDMVELLGWPQPMLSKHLAVLKQVGLVSMRQKGRQRIYRVNGDEIKPIHDWAKTFEKFWTNQLDQIKKRAEEKMKSMETKPNLNNSNTKVK